MDSALNDKRQIDVVFTNVSYNIPPTKTFLNRIKAKSLPPPAKILHSVCGYVAKGQSLAILGPSGSGKTTLLNLLAARSEHPLTSGQILFSGKPRTARTKRNVGYVMQDDVFFSNLTVLETLEFTASIRIPNLSSTQKDILIQKVLRRLRLTKCQNTRIGNQQFDKGISGGERKRLNLANELLHNPSLLLADECTSGLDSSSAYTVITMLHELCQDGHTIIATIHQPSSRIFSKFDSVMLLAAGRVAYFGRPDKVVSYFESIDLPFPQNAYNPADFMLELVIDDIAEEETPHSDIETANSQSVSSQKRVLDSWQKNGPTFLKEVAGESQSLTVKNIEPQSGLTEYIESSDSPSAGAPGKRLSSAVEEMLPIGPGDPTSPGNIPARFVRAVTKRFYDVTFQHSQRNMPEKYPNSWWKQTKVLALRAIRQKRGSVIEPFYVLQVLLVAFTSILFWLKNPPLESTIEDRLGCLSFYVVFWAFFATYNAVYAFPSEMQVLNKDRASGAYRLSAYYVAKTMMETPLDIVSPFIFSLMVYWSTGLNPYFTTFLLFVIVMMLNVLVSQSVGLLLSAVFMDIRKAQLVASLWIISSMLVSGYHIDPDNTPQFAKPLRFLSFIKYSYEALVRVEMLASREFQCVSPGQVSTIYSNNGANCPIKEEDLLRGAQLMGTLSVGWNIAVLLLWIVLLRLSGYFALKLLHTKHKPKSAVWKKK